MKHKFNRKKRPTKNQELGLPRIPPPTPLTPEEKVERKAMLMEKIKSIPFESSWAAVELYRWQHGHLPGEDGKPEKSLDVSVAMNNMADALLKGDSGMPNPFNVAQVLIYAARLLEKEGK